MPRIVLMALLLISMPLSAKVLHSAAAGFALENSVIVPVDVDTAWKALVKDVDRWWPKDHSWFGAEGRFRIEPRAGGCFCETAGKREALHMTVSHVDPGKLLRMLGGLGPLQGMGLYGALEWRLAAEGAGTRITLHYTLGGYTTQDLVSLAPIVDRVQAQQLEGLAKHLRSGITLP